MRKSAQVIFGASVVVLLGAFLSAGPAVAQDKFKLPTEKQCLDKNNPVAKDPITQGACAVVVRTKGNCAACHLIQGLPSGNLAPALVGMKQRFPDKAKLRAQIDDATKVNPTSIMPPFGRHGILSKDEVDNVTEFVHTL
jgi:sulfur-oxidizing protein SoxX